MDIISRVVESRGRDSGGLECSGNLARHIWPGPDPECTGTPYMEA